MSLSPRKVSIRRTNTLFKNVDELQRLAVRVIEENGSSRISSTEKNNSTRAGIVLRTLNEYNVRNMSGALLYGAGLQDYLYGRVSQMKFSKNSLYGKIGKNENLTSTSRSKSSFVDAAITLDTNSKRTKYRTYGDCSCDLSRDEGSLCSHIVALMIAWIRKSQDFEESVKFEFDDAKRRTMESLDKLVSSIEEDDSGFKDDLEMIQLTYAKLKLWATGIVDAKAYVDESTKSKHSQLVLREFSWTINCVSLAIMMAIQNKYRIVPSIELYNNTTVSNFGKFLEALFQSAPLGTPSSTPAKSSKRQKVKSKSAANHSQTARSWDSLVESYAHS